MCSVLTSLCWCNSSLPTEEGPLLVAGCIPYGCGKGSGLGDEEKIVKELL